jgi:hypothetical protein
MAESQQGLIESLSREASSDSTPCPPFKDNLIFVNMKNRSLRQAKARLGKVSGLTDGFDALIQAGKDSAHRPLTDKVLRQIWQRARNK